MMKLFFLYVTTLKKINIEGRNACAKAKNCFLGPTFRGQV